MTAIRVVSVVPTIRKSYFHPWDETLVSWVGFTIANMCTILSLREYNLLTLPYLIAISVLNLVIVGLCLVRRKKVSRAS